MLRLGIASILMLLLFIGNAALVQDFLPTVRKYCTWTMLARFVFMGLFNNVIPFVFVGFAEQRVKSGLVSILDATISLFAIVIAHFALVNCILIHIYL